MQLLSVLQNLYNTPEIILVKPELMSLYYLFVYKSTLFINQLCSPPEFNLCERKIFLFLQKVTWFPPTTATPALYQRLYCFLGSPTLRGCFLEAVGGWGDAAQREGATLFCEWSSAHTALWLPRVVVVVILPIPSLEDLQALFLTHFIFSTTLWDIHLPTQWALWLNRFWTLSLQCCV